MDRQARELARSYCSIRGVRATRRPTAAAALLLHLLVAVLLPLAGSAHDAAAVDRRVHIEEAGGSPSCPRHHDHHECVTCRLAGTAILLSVGCRYAEHSSTVRPPTPAVVVFLPRLFQVSPPSSRAPPTA